MILFLFFLSGEALGQRSFPPPYLAPNSSAAMMNSGPGHPKIILRDIKASNILLDLRFEAEVSSDFSGSLSFPNN